MEDDPFDPFRKHRQTKAAVDGRVGDDEFAMVLGYAELKAVARDWSTFTSDAPFRVPIPSEHDVRSVRQLPIETDPPDHTDYRHIVREPFSRSTADAIAPDVARVVGALLDTALSTGTLEVVRGFALPTQSHALALMLGRSAEEASEWISWGTHVFRDREGSPNGHADELDRFLQRAVDEAVERRGKDFFGLLATATFRGRKLTRDEMLGFANLTFAGGRDTVINSITNSIHHLAQHPAALDELRRRPELVHSATEEFLRYFSPLTHIGRVVATDAEVSGRPVPAGGVVSLCYASANRDEEVFDAADECILDRRPNRHVAFGHGPHTCLGAPLARMVLTVVLDCFATKVSTASVVESAAKIEDLGSMERQVGFERLVLALSPA